MNTATTPIPKVKGYDVPRKPDAPSPPALSLYEKDLQAWAQNLRVEILQVIGSRAMVRALPKTETAMPYWIEIPRRITHPPAAGQRTLNHHIQCGSCRAWGTHYRNCPTLFQREYGDNLVGGLS